MSKVKLFSAFSGIGAFEKGFNRIGQSYELFGYSEIDKYASKGYALIHNINENMNYGDITKIDETKIEKDLDFFTYGFPCQDISLSGNQKGLVDESGNKTRSGLVWDATRIIRTSQPKIAIAENVKHLISKRFKNEFKAILEELDQAGYNNYWKVLNAKEHGVAQNRDRVFIVSIRKNIDNGMFEWPKTEGLTTRLLDYLEDEVDESYFLSDNQIKRITESTYEQNRRRIHDPNKIVSTLCARDYKDPKCVDLTLIIPEKTKKGYATAEIGDGVYIDRPHQKRGVVQKGLIQTLKTSGSDVGVVVKDTRETIYSDKSIDKILNNIVDVNDVANTITANPQRATIDSATLITTSPPLRIRKLTPKECFRLMGFDDKDHDVLEQSGISNTQRYKMAGNSIVVNVVAKILKNLIETVLNGEKNEN